METAFDRLPNDLQWSLLSVAQGQALYVPKIGGRRFQPGRDKRIREEFIGLDRAGLARWKVVLLVAQRNGLSRSTVRRILRGAGLATHGDVH